MSGHLHCSLLALEFQLGLFCLGSFLDVTPEHTNCSALSWVPRCHNCALWCFLVFHCLLFGSLSGCVSVQPPGGDHTPLNEPPSRMLFFCVCSVCCLALLASSVRGTKCLDSLTSVLPLAIACRGHSLHTSHVVHWNFNLPRFAQSAHVWNTWNSSHLHVEYNIFKQQMVLTIERQSRSGTEMKRSSEKSSEAFNHGNRALFHGFTHLTRGDRVRYPRI